MKNNKEIWFIILAIIVISIVINYTTPQTGAPESTSRNETNVTNQYKEDAIDQKKSEPAEANTNNNQVSSNSQSYILIPGTPVNFPIKLIDLPEELVPIFSIVDGYNTSQMPNSFINEITGRMIRIQYGWEGDNVYNPGIGGGYVACPSKDGGVGASVRLSDCDVLTTKNNIRYVRTINTNQLAVNPESERTVTLYFRIETANYEKMKEYGQTIKDEPLFFRFSTSIDNISDLEILANSITLVK